MNGTSDKKIKEANEPQVESTRDLQIIVFELENKIEKAKQNDKILLVDFWVNIIFRCENVRVTVSNNSEKEDVIIYKLYQGFWRYFGRWRNSNCHRQCPLRS